ncbi:MAG: Uma2 family endonuclease [Planctomycetota bacterium]|nr:MAG: Uma2 family endonuclease [Planctomycetota bacterium]
MKFQVIDPKGKILEGPYIIRLPGWTEERYYQEAPRDQKAEFVKGELILMSPMSGEHSQTVYFLSSLIGGFCEVKKLGKILPSPTIRLAPDVNREPDLCFIPQEKLHLATGMPIQAIPPFIIEVSWTTRSIDLGEKAQDYERAQVGEYWVVDIEQKEVVVHLLEEGKYQRKTLKSGKLESREIQGFYIHIDWLWQKPLPSALECLRELVDF